MGFLLNLGDYKNNIYKNCFMENERNIRINKVLRELNISLETAFLFLKSVNIYIEPSPNSKITSKEYDILKNRQIINEIIQDFRTNVGVEIELKIENVAFESHIIESNFFVLDEKNNIRKLNIQDVKVSNLDFLKKYNKIEFLSLRSCGIEDINDLSNLLELKFLNLGGNNIGDYRILKKLKSIYRLHIADNTIKYFDFLPSQLKELYLTDCYIDKIDFLKNSLNLEYLDLSYNIISDINSISELKNLRVLDLSNNKIFDINPLKGFKLFYYLDLSENNIKNIEPLKGIEISNELNLNDNNIFDLTPLYFKLKENKINFLKVHNNPLVYPPKDYITLDEYKKWSWFEDRLDLARKIINNFKSDSENKVLDLGNCGLTDLSLLPELFELHNLEELILSNVWAEYNIKSNEWIDIYSNNDYYPNNIYNIPDDIKNLKNLKKLITGGDWKINDNWNRWRIVDCSFISKLDKIEYVNLSNNAISTFKITRELKYLRTIHLNNNNINSISISKANNLEYLFASNNFIEKLNFLIKSENLKALDLHSNKIKDLYPIKELIKKIGIANSQWKYDTISIAKNDLENPGIDVVNRGKEDVLRMMNRNYGVKTYINDELKLILVGNSESGKTTLAKFLANDTNYKQKHPFTLWMNILKVNYNNKIKINVFDFGGHEYFHDTHHIFFTKNCIYFLLLDKVNDNYKTRELNQIDENNNLVKLETVDYPIFYWLDSIKHFIKESKPDNFSEDLKKRLKENNFLEEYSSSSLIIQNKVKCREDVKLFNQIDITQKYPFIFDFINIDFHNEKNLELLKDRLDEMIENNGNLSGGKYPIYYKQIKDNIYKFKGYLNKKILNFNEFKRLCQGFKRELTKDEEFLDIANFLKDIGLILISKDEKNFYLDLNFISSQIVKIYSGLERLNGIVKEKEIKSKNIKDYESVMKLILDFNLAFEINMHNEKTFIFPLYLQKEPSKVVELLLNDNINIYKKIQYEGFMHKGIILHIFSEYSNKIVTNEIEKNTYYWKNGLIVKENNDLVLIKFFEGNETKNAYIDLYNFANDENFVEKIKEKLLELNKINNYNVKEFVTIDGKNFISLDLIHENESSKNEVFYNDNDSKFYRLYDFKKYLKNKNNTMKKVFISYSRQNLSYKESLKKHLSILERYGLLKAWSCEEIKAGEWNQQIQQELEDSDIIIYMVSAEFMSSNYIMNDEVKKGIELVKKYPHKKIICVLVGVCQWQRWSVLEEIYNSSKDESGKFSMNLSQFQFLPYHQYKNEQGIPIREEIVALEKWGRHPYDVVNEAYNQIVSKIFDEIII